MLHLSVEQYNHLRQVAKGGLPNEVCGLLLGKLGQVKQLVPIKNVAEHPHAHYTMNAQELLMAYQNADKYGLDVLGVYHSHPRHDAIPSQEDIREAEVNTSSLIHLIVSLKYPEISMKAWKIQLGQVDELELLIGQQRCEKLVPMSRWQVWAIVLATLCAVLLLLAMSFALLPAAPPIPTPQ